MTAEPLVTTREKLARFFRARELGKDAAAFEEIHERRGIDPMVCNDFTCSRAVALTDELIAAGFVDAATYREQIAQAIEDYRDGHPVNADEATELSHAARIVRAAAHPTERTEP